MYMYTSCAPNDLQFQCRWPEQSSACQWRVVRTVTKCCRTPSTSRTRSAIASREAPTSWRYQVSKSSTLSPPWWQTVRMLQCFYVHYLSHTASCSANVFHNYLMSWLQTQLSPRTLIWVTPMTHQAVTSSQTPRRRRAPSSHGGLISPTPQIITVFSCRFSTAGRAQEWMTLVVPTNFLEFANTHVSELYFLSFHDNHAKPFLSTI